jgi:hypothetical protein
LVGGYINNVHLPNVKKELIFLKKIISALKRKNKKTLNRKKICFFLTKIKKTNLLSLM